MENNNKRIYITESLCYTPETNTILCINCTLIKKKKKKVLWNLKHPLGETEAWREQAAGSSGPGPSRAANAVWL